MAEVYRAYHMSLDRFVAIKLLHAFLADDPEFKSRFEKEARNIARLKHPHIVQVYDFENDPENDSYYMVMELIDGPTLKDVLFRLSEQGQGMPLAEALRIMREAAGALAYAHSQNMIHRDVKPANLMLDKDNRVVLTDFGIAKIVTGIQFTASGGMVGTPAYMAPEQGLGEAGDERSDLYSLGVIFFQLVTGRLPYEGDTPLSIILKHLNDPTPSARAYNPELPVEADQIISRLMSKDPNDRYQTAGDLIADLERIERGQTLEARPLTSTDEVKSARAQVAAQDTMQVGLLTREAAASREAKPRQAAAAPPAPPPARRRSWVGIALLVMFGAVIGVGVYTLALGGGNSPLLALLASATPTATETSTATLTLTPTLLPTETPTATPTATATPTVTNTASLTPSQTSTASATFTMTLSPSPSPSMTASATPTHTATPTATPSNTLTPSLTPTPTITLTPSVTPTATQDITATFLAATNIAFIQTATTEACDFNYEIVEQTPPDGDFWQANQPYQREIRLRNTGTCAWERNTVLAFVVGSGEAFDAGSLIRIRNRVDVGDETVIEFVGRTPPTGGEVSGTWELRTPGNLLIGAPIVITVRVFEGGG
jgi:serine/threonine-protein kinase